MGVVISRLQRPRTRSDHRCSGTALLTLAPRLLLAALPFYCQFTAGAIAGVSELLLLYPLDTVKTRLMLQTKVEVPGAERYTGMMDAFRKIIASEGYVQGCWSRGRQSGAIRYPLMCRALLSISDHRFLSNPSRVPVLAGYTEDWCPR